MAISGDECGGAHLNLAPCLALPLERGQIKNFLWLCTGILNKQEMNGPLGIGMWLVNSALSTWLDEGFKRGALKKRLLQPLAGTKEEENTHKISCWNDSLSVGETFVYNGETSFDGQELIVDKRPHAVSQPESENILIFWRTTSRVDGAGESKGGDSTEQDDSHEKGSSDVPSDVESAEELKADKEAEASSKSSESIETRIEDQEEEAQFDEGGEDLIRKGKEIFIQGFNWESHKQRWWRSLKQKVPELSAWGFTSMWLPPFCDSLAPQGYLPKNLYNLNSAYGSESELKSLLRQMRKNGVKPMADIVINHRVGSTRGVGDLYNRYDGMPMPWDEHAVTSDTGGLGKPSTGEIFKGIPNLDHSSEVVANDLKNWLQWIRKDVGLDCFRFDYAKGYSPKFVKGYVEASKPRLAIGEYWDTCKYVGPKYVLDYDQDAHRQRTVDWIDGTGGLACAFDFTTKAILQEACAKKEWYRLRDVQGRPPGLLGVWPSRAVTFIDNHDTGSTQAHWPFPREHVTQGYAYILTHPGQPCILYDHLYEWGEETKNAILDLIKIRKAQSVHSRSSIQILEADTKGYAALIDKKLCTRLGSPKWNPPGESWEVATSGPGYMVWQIVRPLLPA